MAMILVIISPCPKSYAAEVWNDEIPSIEVTTTNKVEEYGSWGVQPLTTMYNCEIIMAFTLDGLEMDFTKVPIRQETIEICEIFDVNPYKLQSEGTILIGVPAGEALVLELRRMGLMAAVIGQTNSGNDRMLYYNGNGRYLERPAKDEIYKVLQKQEIIIE